MHCGRPVRQAKTNVNECNKIKLSLPVFHDLYMVVHITLSCELNIFMENSMPMFIILHNY